ncbi:proline-rich protein 11-like isoform X2 [Sinocyclocheilus rhinocerous]|uniref:proline-rich protein 11-like isoform X2 n=1 Tax=Sinocyclocheilus rhinocerous TaxID=307959 RepID=UPI0007B84761|nr:PREDICTED: proline-rich protein 11-like isoform X2 [Sinocyclocheilus rhinocerous]
MPGFRGLGGAFLRRRKRNGSSRRWAIKSKKPLGTPAIPTAPVPNNKTKVDTMEETSVQTTKQLSSTLSIGALFFAFGSVVQKCGKTINQTCFGLLNVFFFWRGYSERVESLHLKVEELQREIALLHSTLKLYREAKTAGGQCDMPDGVQHSTPPPVSLPPPLPPPQILLTLAAPKVASIPLKTAQTTSVKEKQNGPVALTLRDLQAVRLRKVIVGQKTQVSPERKRSPLVTLADLQKVSLRRSNSDLPLKSRSSLGRTVCRTPTKNPMNLRVQLRKVNLMRSPGGTPLFNKENAVMDSSLDPSMTREG